MKTNELEMTTAPVFKASAETERVINRLKATRPGEVVTWLELHELTGYDEDERSHVRACLNTARKHLLSEDQACFAAIVGVGIKHLEPGEVVEQESTTTIRVRRSVKASLRRLSTVDPADLPPQSAQHYRMASAALGAIALCVKPASLDKLKQVTLGSAAIDDKKVLALFGK